MNTETFFDNFELLAEASNGVQKLRSLILELAFNGRLLQENYTELEEWKSKTVGGVSSSLQPGFACNKNNQVPDGYVHLRTHNISVDGRLNLDLVIRIEPSIIDADKANLKTGDVLFNNTNSQELVGKTCLIKDDHNFAFSNHITRIRLKDDVNPYFFVLYMNHLWRRGFFARLCNRWIGQAGINTKMLKQMAIAFPPLDEQKRIAAKVEELMRRCDELEQRQQKRREARISLNNSALEHLLAASTSEEFDSHWQRICESFDLLYDTPETIDKLRRAILKLSMQGHLVLRGSDDRTPDAKSGTGKTVSDCVRILNGYAFKSEWFVSKGIPLLRNVNVGHGNLRWDDTARIPSERMREFDRFLLKEGDIVISLDRPLIATGLKVARVSKEDLPCLLLQRVGKVEFKTDAIIPDYFFLWLNSPLFIDALAPGRSNGVPHISSKSIEALPFAAPPVEEQKRIVAKVDELMKLCDALEAKLKQAQSLSESLTASMVNHIFSTAEENTAA